MKINKITVIKINKFDFFFFFFFLQDTYPIGKEIETGPENSPMSTTFNVELKIILHSFRKEIVQKGHRKS